MKRNKGAQPGNRNARKHGFYSKALMPSEKLCYIFPLPSLAIRFIYHFSLIRFEISLRFVFNKKYFSRGHSPPKIPVNLPRYF